MTRSIAPTPHPGDGAPPISGVRTVADLLAGLGEIPASRVRMQPWPGTATVRDVIKWKRFPRKKRREAGIPAVVPDLVVEVSSKGNTPKEMVRKRGEYFQAGVRLLWYVDRRRRTVRVSTPAGRSVLLGEDDTLDGGDILPGFSLSIREWFAEARRGAAGPGKRSVYVPVAHASGYRPSSPRSAVEVADGFAGDAAVE